MGRRFLVSGINGKNGAMGFFSDYFSYSIFSFRMRQYKQAELQYSINLADSFEFMFLYS